MPSSSRPSNSFFFESDMDVAISESIAGGEAVVYSHRSPDKESPNEDSVALIRSANDTGVLVVADGVGGMPGGEQASKLAITVLSKAIEKSVRDGSSLRVGILNGIEEANRAVLDSGAGGTTLAVAEVSGTEIRTYHVGDSTILLTGQRGRIKLQTIPHSPVGYAVEAGLLEEDEAMVHEDRHLIANAIGMHEMRIEVGSALEMAARDTLLLASDGLSDNLYVAEIIESIRKGKLVDVAETLAAVREGRMERSAVGEPSKPDDLSFILFRQSY